ncbi:uncharacterized protein LOC135593906 isoform X2 [Musa acuminata AAA Group]|uniref:uncharacterized protein LOC135593906 isoform X2 n=1 Tax=Musa acuminata AAA Group TaxID=214697 RepID=UPI0031DCB8CD
MRFARRKRKKGASGLHEGVNLMVQAQYKVYHVGARTIQYMPGTERTAWYRNIKLEHPKRRTTLKMMTTSNMERKFESTPGNSDAHPKMLSSSVSRDLPADIVELILNRLSWPKALSLGRVSRTWRAAVQNYNPMGAQSPCLLHLRPGTVRLFSTVEQRCSLIRRPKLNGECCGAYKSWLVLRHPSSNNMSIVNVLTGASIELPPLQIEGDVFVTLSSTPTARCLLLAEVRNKKESCFLSCRTGDDEWTTLDNLSDSFLVQFSALSDGKLYFAEDSFLFVVDSILRADSEPSLVDSWRFMDEGELSMYLIKCNSEVLVVFAAREDKNGPINDFSVFQLEQDTSLLNMKNRIYQRLLPQVSFVKVESLRDHAIFLGNIQSLCFPVENTGCRENCIYFTQPGDETAWHVFDMGNKRISDGPNLGFKASFRSLVWIEPGVV